MSGADAICERDFYAWSREQARLLREGRCHDADAAHIAEELESLGRSEKRELVSRLAVLLTHLLKWQFQPGMRGRSCELTIREQRRRLARHLADNPSLAALLDPAIAHAYGDSLLMVQQQTGLDEATFPAHCPYVAAAISDQAFLPN